MAYRRNKAGVSTVLTGRLMESQEKAIESFLNSSHQETFKQLVIPAISEKKTV